VKYNYKNSVYEDFHKIPIISNLNSIIFIGDSKDNLLFKYDFLDKKYYSLKLENQKKDSEFSTMNINTMNNSNILGNL
jgi:hypothetical protein